MQREICLFSYWNFLTCAQKLKPKFQFQTSLVRNSPAGTSELLPFGANSDLTWDWILLDILLRDSSLFPPLVFTMLLLSWGITWMVKWRNGKMNISPLGFYYASPLLGNYINHQKYNIAYVPLYPVTGYVYIADLNTRLRVGWKTLPNLNFKLRFQTQTWISQLKYSLSSRVIWDYWKLTPRVEGMKSTKQWVGI